MQPLALMRAHPKISIGSFLGALASIVTILTFVLSANNSTPTYPVNVQANYLNACEANATQDACQCTLSWFEKNVSEAQFITDENQAEAGNEDSDVRFAIASCE